MHSTVIRFALASWLVSASLTVTAADECTNTGAGNVIRCFAVDLAMPDSPGLMIVGLGTDDVVRPTTPRKFGAALVDGVGEDGKPKRGFALDFAPYKLVVPATSRQDYEDHRWLRPLWNAQISSGIGKATDADDKSLRVGFGVASALWQAQSSDPLLNETYQRCLDKRLKELNDTQMPAVGSEFGNDAGLTQCYAAFSKESWHVTALTIGFAGSRFSDTGEWGDLESGPTGAWATFSYAFDHVRAGAPKWLRENSELLLSWRQFRNERVADPANEGSFVDRDSRTTGVLFRLRGDKRNAHLEYSWQRYQRPGDRERTRRTALGIEWQLFDNTWLVVALGKERTRSSTEGDTFIQTGLKFGVLDKPSFAN